MGVHRLNHAVLHVRDAERSARFYEDVLGFVRDADLVVPGAVFLRAADSTNDHDLGLFTAGPDAGPSQAGRGRVGLYHLAWEVDTLADLRDVAARLREAGALRGASDHGTTKSLYGADPDGIEFEVVWLLPADRIEPQDLEARRRIGPLDLDGEIARFGPDLRGGLGVSRSGVASDDVS